MSQVTFKNKWLPYLLVLPQIVITVFLFFVHATLRMAYRTSPFMIRLFVGWQNFQRLLQSRHLASLRITPFFAGA